ncbi:MAG: GNAT family N-acetyltransferase [Prevotellaceae bacterium]|nr:GNAT family N-acetyltransferase [Prevotellaceae bacterium]
MEEKTSFKLRSAAKEDAPFLARCLMEAMGGEVMEREETERDRRVLGVLETLCGREDTLYSWQFATVAETESGTCVGASIAYPGAEYHQRRLVSFGLAREIITFDTERMEDESEAGELYLDTLAVLPRWRRQGVGGLLMRRWLRQAEETGLTATLICATDNAKAHRLYESMGLRDVRRAFVFGEYYQKMALIKG